MKVPWVQPIEPGCVQVCQEVQTQLLYSLVTYLRDVVSDVSHGLVQPGMWIVDCGVCSEECSVCSVKSWYLCKGTLGRLRAIQMAPVKALPTRLS